MNKLINKFAVLIFGLLAFPSFNSTIFAQAKNEVLIVADRKADCTGAAAMKCLQIKKPQDEKWTLFYQNIENFNYAEGYTYILRVRVDTLKNTPADNSNLKYRLRKIIYREKTANENSGGNMPGNNLDLSANAWQLIKIDGANVNTNRAYISFDLTKKTIGGEGGCNGFGGDLSVNGNDLKISGIISTKIFCEDTSEVENKFFANLERVTKYRISGGKLFLLAADKIVLEFAAKK